MTDAGFAPNDRRTLQRRYGPAALHHAIAFSTWRRRRGIAIRDYRAHVVAVLQGKIPADDRYTPPDLEAEAPWGPEDPPPAPPPWEPEGPDLLPTLADAGRWAEALDETDRRLYRERAIASASPFMRRMIQAGSGELLISASIQRLILADSTLFPQLAETLEARR